MSARKPKSKGSVPPTDDSDDLRADPKIARATSLKSKKDAIEEAHGDYFRIGKSSVKLNARAIAERTAVEHHVAYSPENESLNQFQKSTGLWVPIDDHVAHGLVSDQLTKLAEEKNVPEVLYLRNTSNSSQILSHVRAQHRMAKPNPEETFLLPVANGLLDLSGDAPTLRDYAGQDYITQKGPVNWNKKAKCKRWIDELLRPGLEHDDDISLLQRVLGSTLVPGNPAQAIVLISGVGGSGKSTAVSVYEQVIGQHSVAHLRTDKLSSRFETHFFQGKTTLVAKDVSADFLKKGGAALKHLTGADLFETEKKYGGKFQCRGRFNVIITANKEPQLEIAGDAEAWERRMLPFKFVTPATHKIADFAKVLIDEEGPGILNWLVDGYYAARKQFKVTGFFQLTTSQKERRRVLIDASQTELTFVRDQIQKGKGNVTSEEAFLGYVKLCKSKNWSPSSSQRFLTLLPDLMVEYHAVHRRNDITRQDKQVRGFEGVQLRKN